VAANGLPGSGALEVPLTQAQVEAANQLHERMAGWRLFDGVLSSLAEHFPSNCDLAQVLPKAITLNSLYATRIMAIQQMAHHVVSTFQGGCDESSPDLVEKLAALSDLGPAKKTKRFVSFASKYCHFFVNPCRFAIRDTYAFNALSFHIGKKRLRVHRYEDYLNAVDSLRAGASLSCNYSELDHYLWLRGQWMAFSLNENAPINGEAREVFQTPDPAVRSLRDRAFPLGP